MTALYEKNWESAYHHQADTIASLNDQIEKLKKQVKELRTKRISNLDWSVEIALRKDEVGEN